MPREFYIEHDLSGQTPRAVFIFHARDDARFGPELRQEMAILLEREFRSFEIDLRAIESCDSVSLGAFVGLQASVRRVGGSITFTLRRGTHIREMFAVLKLDQVLHVREVRSSERTPQPGARRPKLTMPSPSPPDPRTRLRDPDKTEELMFEPELPGEEDRPRPKFYDKE